MNSDAAGAAGGRPAPTAQRFVYLASQSPRRRQLLDQIGIAHELLLPDPEEDAEALESEVAGELPLTYVRRVTLAKLGAAQVRLRRRGGQTAPVLCADTTVAVGRKILGKPADAADAGRMLRLLSGRSHRVLTAVAIGTEGGHEIAVSDSRVSVASMPDEFIDAYVASGDAFGKAGAYGIQGSLAAWVERIEGSYSGIMGLPLYETARLLRRAGFGA